MKCFSQKLSRTVPSISITLFESFSKPAQAYLILRAGCADKKPLKWLFVFTIGRDCIFNSKYANIQSIPKYVHTLFRWWVHSYKVSEYAMCCKWIVLLLSSSEFEKHVCIINEFIRNSTVCIAHYWRRHKLKTVATTSCKMWNFVSRRSIG